MEKCKGNGSEGFNFLLGLICGIGFSFILITRGFTLVANKDINAKVYIIDQRIDAEQIQRFLRSQPNE